MEASADILRVELEPVEIETSRTALVADRLTRGIFDGVLRPGQRLVERDIAQQLGVSKTPVREALKYLASRGLVTTRAYHGSEVRNVDSRAVVEIFNVRLLLEPAATKEAVSNVGPGIRDDLRDALQIGEEAEERENLVELILANRAFHAHLYSACGNDLLLSLLENLRDQVGLITVSGWRVRPTWHQQAAEHAQILAAAEEGDAALAEQRVRSHIERAFRDLKAIFDEDETSAGCS